ncbi:hypothetical protein BKA80DRAFT_257117 [Phyllosticta citrichinensis]
MMGTGIVQILCKSPAGTNRMACERERGASDSRSIVTWSVAMNTPTIEDSASQICVMRRFTNWPVHLEHFEFSQPFDTNLVILLLSLVSFYLDTCQRVALKRCGTGTVRNRLVGWPPRQAHASPGDEFPGVDGRAGCQSQRDELKIQARANHRVSDNLSEQTGKGPISRAEDVAQNMLQRSRRAAGKSHVRPGDVCKPRNVSETVPAELLPSSRLSGGIVSIAEEQPTLRVESRPKHGQG